MTNFLKESTKNLKNNFILLISSIFFIILNFQNKSYILYQGIACLFIFLLFTRVENIFDKTKKASKFLKFLAIIGAIGIVYFVANRFWTNIQLTTTIKTRDISRLIYVVMIASSFSIYTFLALLYNHLSKIFYDVFHNMTKLEKFIYFLIALFLIIIIIRVFTKTNVFFDQKYVYDVVFTSDIGAIVRDNAYMNLYHPENDIRQPLFAVFAMPFMAIAYTISLVFPFVG